MVRPSSIPSPRRSVRGVAMLEALMVACVMMLFLAGTVFLHDANVTKGATVQQARQQAWAATRPKCSGASLTGSATESVAITAPLQATQSTLALVSRTTMGCNEEPNDEEDMPAALDWAGANIDGIFDASFEAIQRFLPF